MTEHVYVHIFRNIFGVTFYINISVTDTHVQSESIKKQTHMSPLCAHSIGSLDIQIKLPHLIYRNKSVWQSEKLVVNFVWMGMVTKHFSIWSPSRFWYLAQSRFWYNICHKSITLWQVKDNHLRYVTGKELDKISVVTFTTVLSFRYNKNVDYAVVLWCRTIMYS